ncbi:MAG: peptide chain release factor N(5)-glutamine methyltransferase [Kiritimatiellaeota bacterium]|nr:peptide chain release factor N(5)-glutamine methyltransferase [Kiritimatiellota bacterium]
MPRGAALFYGAGMDSGAELKRLAARLQAAGVDEAQTKAEVLLAHALGCRRLEVYTHPERRLTPVLVEQLRAQSRRLAAGEPLQYVLGAAEFYGRSFKTDPRALIPRPETELLVETALGLPLVWKRAAPRVADAGAGTGCLAITLALERPGAHIFAVDISADALALARENAQRHGVSARIAFMRGDGLAAFAPASLDLVVSNPPYVPTEEWNALPRDIRDHEPRVALDGGADGLAVLWPCSRRWWPRRPKSWRRPAGWSWRWPRTRAGASAT